MSRTYTQQELLLLSNFVYIPACLDERPISEIIDTYRDADGGFSEKSVYAAAAGGGMSLSEVKCVFENMDERIKEDPSFGRLSVSRTLNEDNVRALCYTGSDDTDPVVVFRGTGGTEDAWSDNFKGAFYEDTKIQKTAYDFIRYDCGIYEGITVTGHSKGGNMAQYVTVMGGDRIKECVSYDGQGFSEDFLGKYPEEVEAASGKITSISAYNDFVNILLTCIAGTCIYVANESSAAGAHSSVTLLSENEFDENGDFVTVRRQGAVSKELGRVTRIAVEKMGSMSKDDKDAFSVIAGSAISLALSMPQGEGLEGVMAPVLGKIGVQFAKKITEAVLTNETCGRPVAKNAYMDAKACKGAACIMKDKALSISAAVNTVEAIRQNLAYTISAKLCAEHALEHICYDLTRLGRSLMTFSEFVEKAAAGYERCELEAVSLVFS
ncbi:MAG: DUF2974 domain-containing protein [Lachnospiraceae bacterium]|nr:DUF2974 domain-containing protein [Lachnospiraceae bacterium]